MDSIGSILMALGNTLASSRRNAPGGTNDGRMGGAFRGREDTLPPMGGAPMKPSITMEAPGQGPELQGGTGGDGFHPAMLANGPSLPPVTQHDIGPPAQDAMLQSAMAGVSANPHPVASPPTSVSFGGGISDDMVSQAMMQLMKQPATGSAR